MPYAPFQFHLYSNCKHRKGFMPSSISTEGGNFIQEIQIYHRFKLFFFFFTISLMSRKLNEIHCSYHKPSVNGNDFNSDRLFLIFFP